MPSVSTTAITITVRMQANMLSMANRSPKREMAKPMPSEAAKNSPTRTPIRARPTAMRGAGDDVGQHAREDHLAIKIPLAAAERAHHVDQQAVDRAHAGACALKMKGKTESENTMIALPDTPTPKKITSSGASATSGLA